MNFHMWILIKKSTNQRALRLQCNNKKKLERHC